MLQISRNFKVNSKLRLNREKAEVNMKAQLKIIISNNDKVYEENKIKIFLKLFYMLATITKKFKNYHLK